LWDRRGDGVRKALEPVPKDNGEGGVQPGRHKKDTGTGSGTALTTKGFKERGRQIGEYTCGWRQLQEEGGGNEKPWAPRHRGGSSKTRQRKNKEEKGGRPQQCEMGKEKEFQRHHHHQSSKKKTRKRVGVGFEVEKRSRGKGERDVMQRSGQRAR